MGLLYYAGHPSFKVGGQIQRQLLSRDGLHLSQTGTRTVVNDIETAIQYLLSAFQFTSSVTVTPEEQPIGKDAFSHDGH
jgi:hypothetical protein